MDTSTRSPPATRRELVLSIALVVMLCLQLSAYLGQTEAIARADDKTLANPLEQRATMIELLRSIDLRLSKLEQHLVTSPK